MTARVLVVDDILANVKLLEARLSAEYFEVLTAFNGHEALELLETQHVDVVLLDAMMPGMDGFEVCRRMRLAPRTAHLPVVMVTALDQPADKVHGLKAGADDFLTKPVDEVALVSRVRNLARLKALNDEIALRVSSGIGMGLLPACAIEGESEQAGARILLVEDQERAAQRVVGTLGKAHGIDVETDVARALLRLGEEAYDVALISLGLAGADGLRLCSQVRSFERLRHLPIVVIVEPGDDRRLLRALDMGVNDYLTRPIDRQELIARVRTQLRRKRRSDHLRKCLDASVGLAVTDPLTGLSNRRHLEGHLTVLVERARSSGQPLSVLMADIDHFKSVNDAYGHAAGDAVLREFAQRLRRNVRAVDLVCRLGGEEFIIVMPNTSEELARDVGQRVCACIAEEAFQIDQSTRAGVTASVGLATLDAAEVEADALLRRADQALYRAKRAGRNRVVAHAA